MTTKKLCIISLTRIFLLTREYQTLVREVTTPSIPGFISSCLDNVSLRTSSQSFRKPNAHSPLLETVLEALGELLPHHSTSFRPFVAQIRSLILPLIVPTPSNMLQDGSTKHSVAETDSTTFRCTAAAQRLFVLLHCCAAKNTSGDEWNKALRTTIANIHNTTDQVFRAVFEDWEHSNKTLTNNANPKGYGEVVSDAGLDLLGLPGWKGIHAGCERLSGLLQLLQSFLATQSSTMVSLPVGAVVDVTTRVLSLLVPAATDQRPYEGGPRLNPEIAREEREALWAILPQIHVTALRTLSTLLARLGAASSALSHGLLDLLLWLFRSEHTFEEIRTSTYELVLQILIQVGPSLPRSVVSSMSPLIRSSCKDLLPSQERPAPNLRIPGNKTAQSNGMTSVNADSFLVTATPSNPQNRPGLQAAAAALLPLLLMSLPRNTLSFSLRSLIDRTAVLSRNKEAMLASVLNPPTGKMGSSSIMPLLARALPETPAVEAVIRPRMPVLQRRRDDNGDIESDEDEILGLQYSDTYAGDGLVALGDAGPSEKTSTQLGNGVGIVETAIAGARADPVLPSSPAGMHEAESSILDASNKRGRSESCEEASPTTVPDPVSILPDPPQQREGPTIKRVRLDSEAVDTENGAPNTSAHVAVGLDDDVHPKALEAKSAVPASSATAGIAVGAEANSDEDDFEIPPLDMGLDTDEEDDEEDE